MPKAVAIPRVLRDPTYAKRVLRVLDSVRDGCDLGARRAKDPVDFVHRQRTPADQELVGLLASSLAFGNVVTIRQKVAEVLARLGQIAASPARASESLPSLLKVLEGFVHRLFRGEDVARLLYGARTCQLRDGSLEATFCRGFDASDLSEGDATWDGLAFLVDAIRKEGGLDLPDPHGRRGARHLLPDVKKGGGAKRLFLFLRWMARPADGVDLGVWRLPPRLLFCPVDTHILKLGRNLGLTTRSDAGARTVREITASLASFDAADPIKYDFSLCHLGMATRCRERHDPPICDACPARTACRHVPHVARPTSGPLVRSERAERTEGQTKPSPKPSRNASSVQVPKNSRKT